MPELPEVETVARQLAPHLLGRRVRAFHITDPLLRSGPVPRLAGRRIAGVDRSGKRVRIAFTGPPRTDAALWLAVHLRMTGRLIWVDDGARASRERMRARFRLDRGELLFLDTRRFGTFSWYGSAEETEPDGVEPLSRRLTSRRMGEMLDGSRQSLKAWLMRQDRLVGIGNIYASEILYTARLSPLREAGSLDAAERSRLLHATRGILRRAIRACGTTFSDFQDSRGVEGSYQRYLKVYARDGERCRRCGAEVVRLVQQQRSTFFCPGCQV